MVINQKVAKPFESYDTNDGKVVILKLDLFTLGAGVKVEICVTLIRVSIGLLIFQLKEINVV